MAKFCSLGHVYFKLKHFFENIFAHFQAFRMAKNLPKPKSFSID